MPLLLDTGAICALADADDAWHPRMREFIASGKETLVVPVTVLAEVTYLLRSRLGAAVELAFARSLAANELSVESLQPADLERASELLGQYPAIGYVDATVAALAERLRLRSIVTTDRRHFSTLRPVHVDAFELLP